MKNIEKSFSIILPTFNEVGHIKKLVLEISNIFISSNLLFEVIIVDDNSTDGTINIIHDLEKKNDNIIVLVRKKRKVALSIQLMTVFYYQNMRISFGWMQIIPIHLNI